MGLDMYLDQEIYVGGQYEHNNVTGEIKIFKGGKELLVPLNKVSEINLRVGYWRKANAIHKWFVDNVQDGKDECQRERVSFDKLQELKRLCLDVIECKSPEKLPPQSGFFFGSTEVDEDYYQDLKDTINIIDSLDPNGDYYYHSSW